MPAAVSSGSPAAGSAEADGPAACPADMVLVEGRFCPAADQRCDPHDPESLARPEQGERCRKFTEPSRCVSEKRVLVRYCVDRYEWPNREGELPSVLVDFADARKACESAGKRLCDESEWLFACEGEAMLPYVNGYERDATACVIDRPYIRRPHRLERWDACMAEAECRRDFERVDQRQPSGAFARCVSPFGAHDMNGNVNEWVNVPGEHYPHRSALKGGWWGPVRDRCRPTVRFHDESDYGYEIGFRCCRDAKP
jgi:formylglycine-generating enzyme